MNEHDMECILREIKAAIQDISVPSHDKYWSKMHLLAEAQYLPAFTFFLSCLDDSRADWREDCLTCLGFHYAFPTDSEAIRKIRQLLLNDRDDFVRIAAAAVLGSRSQPFDPALIDALQLDDDEDVRYTAFAALLKLSGVPALIVRQEVERAKNGIIQASLEELKRISNLTANR